MQQDFTERLQAAAADDREMEQLIEESAASILKIASKVCRRYITSSDDEWSVALAAFLEAVRGYQPERGGFWPYAEKVIRSRLVDYYRGQARYGVEIPATPEVFASGPLEDSPQPALQAAVTPRIAAADPTDLRLEIEAANQVFAGYGFSFFDLADCSPKAGKTKTACAKAVACLLKNPLLLCDLRSSKQLPIKAIEKNSKVPRKILDRHRKYIIAAAEILSGEYPGLAEYMRFIREELDR